MNENISFSIVTEKDINEVITIMKDTNLSVSGLKCTGLYKALSYDAVYNQNVLLIIGIINQKIIGYYIIIFNWLKYWKKFFLYHPCVSLKIIKNRIKRRLLRNNKCNESVNHVIDKYICPQNINAHRYWEESSPQIAKLLYYSVHNKYRGKGYGTKILMNLLEELQKRGIKRIDAHIGFDNISSIKTFFKTGWKIIKQKNSLLASIDFENK